MQKTCKVVFRDSSSPSYLILLTFLKETFGKESGGMNRFVTGLPKWAQLFLYAQRKNRSKTFVGVRNSHGLLNGGEPFTDLLQCAHAKSAHATLDRLPL